jgi:hypothetical protein
MGIVKNADQGRPARHRLLNEVDHGLGVGRVQ